MTRKKNAEPCPRCKLIRQEWKRGFGYSQCLYVKGSGIYDDVCHECARRISSEIWRAFEIAKEHQAFAENEMWSLERGAL